jgi:hypothetical protein
LKAELPRILGLLGAAFMVIGLVGTIVLVATDSSCNSVTSLQGGSVAGSGFCGHAHGLLSASFIVLVVGALLLAVGALVLPTLRTRDARQAALDAAQPADPPEPD